MHAAPLFLTVLFVGALVPAADAATIQVPSCNFADVQNAVNSAQAGDTILLPAGTCTWSTQLTINKGVTLAGAGIDQTILRDNVPKSNVGANRLISFNVQAPENFRLTQFTIQGVATDPARNNHGHVALNGTSKAFRIDNIKFSNMQTVGIRTDGDLWGVIDHCQFFGSFQQGVFISHSRWGGSTYGDGSWAEPIHLGTEKAIYLEDNTFTEASALYAAGAIDALDGARVVFRRNTVIGTFIATHGTESGQRRRSIRSFEIYENNVTLPAGKMLDRVFYIRGGTGAIWGNTVSGQWNHLVSMQNFRDSGSYVPWGKCDGSAPYDQNGPGGYRCVDQPGAGTSNLISGQTPPTTWIGNSSDPIYIWGNTGGSFTFGIAGGSRNVVVNRDFFVGIPRPGYVPYTYPHPLASGLPPPASPTNVRIVPGS